MVGFPSRRVKTRIKMPFGYFFSFLVLAMLVLMILVGWFGALALLVKGRRKQSRWQAWLGGAGMALIPLPGIWLLYLFLAPPNPAIAYKDAFGAAPSSDVTELRSSEDGFADWSTVYLKFKASPATIERLTTRGWKKYGEVIQSEKDKAESRTEEMPGWWNLGDADKIQVFSAQKRRKDFSTQSDESLYYDPKKGEAFYSYEGMD